MKELNECRQNPSAYADKVEQHLQYIKVNSDAKQKGGFLYEREGMPKVALNQGEIAFKNFIQKLRETKPLEPIEFRSNLQIPINADPKKWTDKDYIGHIVNDYEDE